MCKKVILFSLQTFSTTGGIQKMTRTLAHAINTLAEKNSWDFNLWSLYDSEADLMPQYLPAAKFRAFSKKRFNFMLRSAFSIHKPDVIILSHVNLALVGLLIQMINPGCRVWLIAHGIEVWRPLSVIQRRLLKRCDSVICVSDFTKQQMITRHGVNPNICKVLNNAVDPFMDLPQTFDKPENLLQRYRLKPEARVIFTLTRLASTEQYKGHDQVIKVLPRLKQKYPDIKYILAGQYDHKEEIRIQKLITRAGVDENVILTGFVDEAEIPDHFLLADLFVLPSKKEGFGIVFIEALACGLPVVCGNADGSIDAINNGKLGTAVNADDLAGLENAIANQLNNPLTAAKRKQLQADCLSQFNENGYIDKLQQLLN